MDAQLAVKLEALLDTPLDAAPSWPELEPLLATGYAEARRLERHREQLARVLEADGMGDPGLAALDLLFGARIEFIRQQLAAVRCRFQPGLRS